MLDTQPGPLALFILLLQPEQVVQGTHSSKWSRGRIHHIRGVGAGEQQLTVHYRPG